MKDQVLQRLREEQVKLRMQMGVGKLPQHHLLRKVRKDIARQMTLNHQETLRALGVLK